MNDENYVEEELLQDEETPEMEENIEQEEDPRNNEEVQEKEDKIPLTKYMQEKKRRKDLEKRLRDLEEKSMSQESKERANSIKQLVQERGYDEGVADLFSDMFNEITKQIPKVDRFEQEILEDIQDYADDNPEVLKYKKEIVEKVKKYRKADPDFSVEDALSLIKPSKIRYSELKTDIEQKQALERRKVEGKKVATSSASSPKNPYPLDEADKKALEGLQKAQPDKNWTAEKYWKRKNS